MAIRSGFFMSVDGDRKYDAPFFAEYFASFIGNGVFPDPSTNMQVIANNDMSVTVKKGRGWIDGYVAFNDDDYILQLDPADGVLNRIDRIVLRWDLIDRKIKLQVKKGKFGSQPVAPTLQRDADAYELALADVRVNNGVVSITQSAITDRRLNDELCGIVHGVVEQVDVTTLFNQYETAFEEDITQFRQDFDAFLSQLEGTLEGDVAGNLLSMITQVQNDLNAHLANDNLIKHKAKQIELQDTANLFASTNVEEGMNELFTNVSNGKDLVSGAITDVDDSVVIPTEPSFADLAGAIGGISTGKKWASGVESYNSDFGSGELYSQFGVREDSTSFKSVGYYHKEVRGLDFTPSTIIAYYDTPKYRVIFIYIKGSNMFGHNNSNTVMLYTPTGSNSSKTLFLTEDYTPIVTTSYFNIVIDEILSSSGSHNVTWIAFE